jgi:hypothetical protein
MIQRAFVVRDDGEVLYVKSYDEKSSPSESSMPPHARACVMLFGSNSSTVLEELYTLDQGEIRWAYMFFNSFAVVLLTTPDEANPHLKMRMMSLGKAITMTYGGLMTSWSGDMGQIADMDDLVDSYVRMEIGRPSEELTAAIEKLVDASLESHTVAYAGVFDAAGDMIHGTVPESHATIIQSEISRGTVKPGVDIVPTVITIEGHEVCILRVQSYTVVAASYRDESRLTTSKAASEIAHGLDAFLHEKPKAPKRERARRKA